jgi:DHA2 family multidrug resistance protein
LYATTLALLTPYLQTLMNYPVVAAGTMLAMMVCGRLVGKVSGRLLVSVGFITTAWSLYDMTSWTPDISERAVIVAGFIQGVSVGFVFVPLSTTTFETLPAELRTQATGVFSLVRNIGSAIGISITGALLQTNTQINHAIIVSDMTPFNRALQGAAVSSFWDPLHAQGAAMLNDEVSRQATIIAYVNDFKLMSILALAALPLVLLIRRGGPRQSAGGHRAIAE